jgi:hypothetical protein
MIRAILGSSRRPRAGGYRHRKKPRGDDNGDRDAGADPGDGAGKRAGHARQFSIPPPVAWLRSLMVTGGPEGPPVSTAQGVTPAAFCISTTGTMRPCSGRIWSTTSPCFMTFSARLTVKGLGGLIGATFGAGGV